MISSLQVFWLKFCMNFSSSLHILFDLMTLIFVERYKWWSSCLAVYPILQLILPSVFIIKVISYNNFTVLISLYWSIIFVITCGLFKSFGTFEIARQPDILAMSGKLCCLVACFLIIILFAVSYCCD
jgi:hypothetical protein